MLHYPSTFFNRVANRKTLLYICQRSDWKNLVISFIIYQHGFLFKNKNSNFIGTFNLFSGVACTKCAHHGLE